MFIGMFGVSMMSCLFNSEVINQYMVDSLIETVVQLRVADQHFDEKKITAKMPSISRECFNQVVSFYSFFLFICLTKGLLYFKQA